MGVLVANLIDEGSPTQVFQDFCHFSGLHFPALGTDFGDTSPCRMEPLNKSEIP